MQGKTPITAWRTASGTARVYWTAYALFAVLTLGTSLVEAKATTDMQKLLNGRESPSFYTVFDLRSDRPGIDGHLFRVVLHRDGNYYAVPAMSEAANGEVLVVIPETDVISAITVRG